MPLPSTRVLHPRWAEHHRPVAEGAMTGTVTIRRPDGTAGDFDDETGARQTVPYPAHYSGPCRIQVLTLTERDVVAGEEAMSTVGYLVTVPLDAANGATDFAVKDIAHVDAVDDNGDSTMVGRNLTVDSVARGSLAFERDLICTDSLG